MARTVSARLEDELEERYATAEEAAAETNKSAFLRSVVDDGLQAKNPNPLDAIDASDELRAAVEKCREEGEGVDDTVRRLLREGARTSRDEPQSWTDRAVDALAVGFLTGTVVLGSVFAGLPGALAFAGFWAVLLAFDDVFLRAIARLVGLTGTADEIRGELEEAREERPDVEERERASSDADLTTDSAR